jgi:hypothetical protein
VGQLEIKLQSEQKNLKDTKRAYILEIEKRDLEIQILRHDNERLQRDCKSATFSVSISQPQPQSSLSSLQLASSSLLRNPPSDAQPPAELSSAEPPSYHANAISSKTITDFAQKLDACKSQIRNLVKLTNELTEKNSSLAKERDELCAIVKRVNKRCVIYSKGFVSLSKICIQLRKCS